MPIVPRTKARIAKASRDRRNTRAEMIAQLAMRESEATYALITSRRKLLAGMGTGRIVRGARPRESPAAPPRDDLPKERAPFGRSPAAEPLGARSVSRSASPGVD